MSRERTALFFSDCARYSIDWRRSAGRSVESGSAGFHSIIDAVVRIDGGTRMRGAA